MSINQKQTLQGQHIIILGGTSGIGLATAQLAASEGAKASPEESEPFTCKELQRGEGSSFAN